MIDITFTICSGLVMLIIGGILFFYCKKWEAGYLYQEEINKVDILKAVTGLILFLGALCFGGGILFFIASLSELYGVLGRVLQFVIAIFVVYFSFNLSVLNVRV